MEDVTGDVCCAPLFGDTTISTYFISGANRTVTCKTRSISHVSQTDDGSCGLFADNLWPGSFVLADFLSKNTELCKNKYVLELGAGSALPSLVAAVLGAQTVVVTDYPEDTVIENISQVIHMNKISNTVVIPYRWGDSVAPLLECTESKQQFDLILLAELLWKDTYPLHDLLLQSISQCLDKEHGIGIMTFVHRPTDTHTPANDLEFFENATRKYGLLYKRVGSCSKYYDVFEEEHVPAEVHIYGLYFSAELGSLLLNV